LLRSDAEDPGASFRQNFDLDVVTGNAQTLESGADCLFGCATSDLDAVSVHVYFPFLLRLDEGRRRGEDGCRSGDGVIAGLVAPAGGRAPPPRYGRLPHPTVKRCWTM